MPLLRRRAALGVFLIAITISANLVAQQTGSQADSAAQEPTDSSFEEALAHGIAAFKNAHYTAAVQHFKTAVAFDPASPKARLYLGTVYAYQVVPNLDTPDNLATAKNAIDTLKQVPEGAPEYLVVLKQIASLYRNTNRLDEAKETERQVLRLDPTDAEAHYALGAIDWMQAYKNAVRVLATADLHDDGNGNPKLNTSACLELREQNSALVQDGIDHLTRAIDLKPDYDDAMQYLNLTYRRHADFACGDDRQRTEDITKAEQWTKRAMTVRRQNQSSALSSK
jgi:tetratricopeptide (TPR) repeat protein